MANKAKKSKSEDQVLLELIETVDQIIEESEIKNWTLKTMLDKTFPALKTYFKGCKQFFVYTYNENLAKQHYLYKKKPDIDFPLKEMDALAQKEYQGMLKVQDYFLYINKLDVLGEYYGFTGIVYEEKLKDKKKKKIFKRLNTFNEILDNQLKAMHSCRLKQQVYNQLMEALREYILDDGIDKAVSILHKYLGYKNLMLFYFQSHEFLGNRVHYRIVKGKEIVSTSSKPDGNKIHEQIKEHNDKIISGEIPDTVLKSLPFDSQTIIPLKYGVSYDQIAGYLIIEGKNEILNMLEQDILYTFINILIQRIVDFDKEYKYLAQFFNEKCINLLIRNNNYNVEVLSPREKSAAIVYADISSFSKITEKILDSPSLIAELIDDWYKEMVEVIWSFDGVLDKFVGDCVIGFFGPPYFDGSQKQWCLNAVNAAIKIREVTDSFNAVDKWKVVKESGLLPGIGVSTGVNFAPLYIGLFGPNRDYTAFSTGMNNTARLQGLAGFNEILIMDSIKNIIKNQKDFQYSEEKEATVKNVATPLKYFSIDTKA